MRFNLTLLVLSIIIVAIVASNCLCIDYFRPPMQWYNYSFDPEENVTIGMHIYNLGVEPVTIHNSDMEKITLSAYSYDDPGVYETREDNQLNIFYVQPGREEVEPTIKTDNIVYLPRGPNYTIVISNGGYASFESPVIVRYTGGNLTLWVNNPDHLPQYPYHFPDNPIMPAVTDMKVASP